MWQLAPGMPDSIREGVRIRPCQGCNHPRDSHRGWMNLYACQANECTCSGYDRVDSAAALDAVDWARARLADQTPTGL